MQMVLLLFFFLLDTLRRQQIQLENSLNPYLFFFAGVIAIYYNLAIFQNVIPLKHFHHYYVQNH
jgi:hypothetical protein